jgi:hypothetical protein
MGGETNSHTQAANIKRLIANGSAREPLSKSCSDRKSGLKRHQDPVIATKSAKVLYSRAVSEPLWRHYP